MAITKCPECGGKISTTVEQCIHCGCKITVCPECGMTYKCVMKQCTECGYSFESATEKDAQITQETTPAGNTPNQAPAPQQSSPSATADAPSSSAEGSADKASVKANVPSPKEIMDEWRENAPFSYAAARFFKITLSVFFWIPTVLGALLLLLVLRKSGSRQAALLVGGVVCFAIGHIFDRLSGVLEEISNNLRSKSLWSWSQKRGLDLMPILEKSFCKDTTDMGIGETMKHTASVKDLLRIQYDNAVASIQTKAILSSLLRFLFGTVFAVLAACFVGKNSEVITTSIRDVDAYNGVILLMVAILFAIVGRIITHKIEKNTQSEIDTWVAKVFSPRTYTQYQKNIK